MRIPSILFMRSTQYYVNNVNLLLRKLMRFLRKKKETVVRPILLKPHASSTCVHLRLLAGPFGQGFRAKIVAKPIFGSN